MASSPRAIPPGKDIGNMKVFVIIYLCFIVTVFLVTIKDFDSMADTPKELYEINDFNMFAAVILFCIMLVLNPLFYITKFLWWLFHVGRDGR